MIFSPLIVADVALVFAVLVVAVSVIVLLIPVAVGVGERVSHGPSHVTNISKTSSTLSGNLLRRESV